MTSIAVVTPSFYPMIGGVENYVLGMGEVLARKGFEVHVYTPDRVLGNDCGTAEETVSGIHVHRIKVPLEFSYRIKVWPGLTDSLVDGSPDLIHVYSHDSYTMFALQAAKKLKVPVALTTYGPFETHSDYGPIRAGAFKIYDSLVTPSIMRRSSAVFVRYPSLIRWVESFGLERGRIHLEPSGIPEGSLSPRDPGKFRKQIGSSGPVIMYLGRISSQKGVQFAIDSMVGVTKAFPDAKLVLIGPDYSGFADELRRMADAKGVGSSVLIMKELRDEESQMEAIAGCDVFVMPSSFEGFSQAVMKAMAQGKPVVVTNVGGLPYEVDYGSCGSICEYGDSQGLADSIISLIRDRELAQRLGAGGKSRASMFTFDALAPQLAEHYSRLVN